MGDTTTRKVRGEDLTVPTDVLESCIAAYDLWRDGKGPYKGKWANNSFLLCTAFIALQFGSKHQTVEDPVFVHRLLRVFRSVLRARQKTRASDSLPLFP
jgi:hypothetical protein